MKFSKNLIEVLPLVAEAVTDPQVESHSLLVPGSGDKRGIPFRI